MKTHTAIAMVASAAAVLSTVSAHGGMISPESREIRTMGLDINSSFGWPINMRPGGDCLNNTPDKNLQTMSYGSSKIRMQANDGANHIGPCSVYLIDPSDSSNKLQVGQLDDCMRSLHPAAGNKGDPPIYAEMSIDIPQSGLPCSADHCVLEFYWEATHLEPHEIFNNCADIKLSGSSGSSSSTPSAATSAPVTTTQAPVTTTQAPATTTSPPATTTAAPTSSSSAKGSSGTYVAVNVESGMQSAMDSWCNANCNNNPPYCPESTCKAV